MLKMLFCSLKIEVLGFIIINSCISIKMKCMFKCKHANTSLSCKCKGSWPPPQKPQGGRGR